MSWITPAWMLGKFSEAYDAMEAGKISVQQFYDVIKSLPTVPDTIKSGWKDKVKTLQKDKGS